MNHPKFVYISQGGLHLLHDGGATTRLESAFGRSLRERAAQIHQRHAWKSEGRGAQFMSGMLWGAQPRDTGEFPIHITGVCRGPASGHLLYTLETNDVGGVFLVDADGVERRLFHTADFRLRHLSLSPDGEMIAASVAHNTFITNIAVLSIEGNEFYEATEGDSVDFAPRWVPGRGRRLVYQSAGVGRNAAGQVTGFSPFAIHELNLDTGAVTTLVEEPEKDLLSPHMTSDETLYYIRKEHPHATKVSPLAALKDAVLFPFRMLYAVFQFFNFFSMRYTGKPLVTPKGAAARHLDPMRMMIFGNLSEAARMQHEEDPQKAIVPDSWELVRRTAGGGTKVMAKGVLSFDITPDGDVVYSNGNAIHRLTPEGRTEKVLQGKMIEQVAVL
ncbi:MAG: hypothetical protein HY820_13895 [Acidobacteria bacterium]|nr:hypothetical protein [Acidobacteriota bacterium]